MKMLLRGAATALGLILCMPAMAEDINILSIEQNGANGKEYYLRLAKSFEEENPGITVRFEFLDDASFKSKLPTLLQSSARPDAFYTWTGGVFQEQAKAGILKDISLEMDAEARAVYTPSSIEAHLYDGKLYGIPLYAAGVALFYNRELTEEAGIDPNTIKTWDDFLSAVQQIKKVGITPIILDGKDKWPIAFYYSYLASRVAGTAGIKQADEHGFDNDDFVRAGQLFKQLVDLEPFQQGFMDTNQNKGAGLFGDGRGAFYLMGNFMVGQHAKNSTSGKGLGNKLDYIPFPAVDGGKGNPADTLGGVSGWLVTKEAAPSTVKFLRYLTNRENQLEGGRLGLWLPVANDAQSQIQDPRLRGVAELLAKAPHHQLYLDQAFGAVVGAAFNDAAAQIATGELTPEDAAALIEDARALR